MDRSKLFGQRAVIIRYVKIPQLRVRMSAREGRLASISRGRVLVNSALLRHLRNPLSFCFPKLVVWLRQPGRAPAIRAYRLSSITQR
ncbi:hypothetical protein AB4Y32_29065 [Paraburkholderia phymatum]|uniref:Uncharacterized protein n=1 Tax=Paraburkholderia phymatum TaxID=148447 RepID=A0ACC6U836_9BURK